VYDGLGRNTSIPAADAPNSVGVISLSYRVNDQVASITQNGVATAYSFDGLGRRVSETTGSSVVTKHYTGTSDNPAWSSNNAGVTDIYTSSLGTGLNGTVTLDNGVKTLSLDVNDLRGNTVTRINVDSATTDSWVSFDEYGNRDSASTGKLVTYDAYGQYERATTSQGLILMGARVYSPVTNQFTSPDPITGGNETSYTYPNDPINKNDFTGLYSTTHEKLSIGLDIAVTTLGWMACKGAFAICVGVSALFGALGGALKGMKEANERGLKGWDYFGHLAGSVAIDAGSAAIGAVVGRGAEKLIHRALRAVKTNKKVLKRFRTSADVSAGYFAGSYVSSRASSARDHLLYGRKNK
jgi:RHS repeat-associated protein